RVQTCVVTLTFKCLMTMYFFSSRKRHTISKRDWSSDVCSSDLTGYFMAKVMRTAVPAAALIVSYILFVHLLGGQLQLNHAQTSKIGRASCRERVWGSGVHGRVQKDGRREGNGRSDN